MPAVTALPRRRVAVADDNPSYRRQKSQVITVAGYDPVPLEATYPTINDMIAEIRRRKATALLCDHKLTEGSYAGFQGVEAVASLYGSRIPAILVTDYVDSDLPSITRFRRKVPVLIRGNEMRPKGIVSGINAWEQEVINKDIPVQRRPRKAVVMVDDLSSKALAQFVVFVPRWREHEAILLSEEMFPQEIRDKLKKGTVLTATVNTDAERSEDLYFEDFRLTPDEDLRHEPA